MSWFKRQEDNGDERDEGGGLPDEAGAATGEKRVKTEGLWIKCEACKAVFGRPIWKRT